MWRANAAERLGVGPAQWRTISRWWGDSSDNVPGVKGIGGRGVELLQIGDLDSLLGRAEEVKNKRAREALIDMRTRLAFPGNWSPSSAMVPVTLDPAGFEEC